MKYTGTFMFKVTIMLAAIIFVSNGLLISPTEAANLSDFAGQTTASGRIWWWFL